MRYTIALVISILLFAGLLQSCKHDPVSTPPDTTKTDTTHRTLRITPDSLHTAVMTQIVYTARPSPGPFLKPYKLVWNVDGTLIERVNSDTISVQFSIAGVHSIGVTWLDSTGKEDASDTTIAIATVIHTPNDTTSHVFAWTEYNIPLESSLNSVFVFDSANIYTIGDKLWTLSGSNWIQVPMKDKTGRNSNGGLSSMRLFGFTPNDFWIAYGEIVIHDSVGITTMYRLQENPMRIMSDSDGALRAAWGTSSKNMYFVGDKGTIIHFDGTTWTNIPKVTAQNLISISGTSDHDIWACGYDFSTGGTVLLHFDGQSWSVDPFSSHSIDETGGFLSVWAGDSAGVPIAVTAGSFIHQKTGSGAWRSCLPNIPNELPDNSHAGTFAAGSGPNDIMATASWGYVMHWNGKSWKRWDEYRDLASVGYFPHQVSFKGNTACIVGLKGGGSWILLGRR